MAMESVFRLFVAMYVVSYVCLQNAACYIILLLPVQYITAVTCIIERNKITHLDSYRVRFVIFIMHFVINLFPVVNISLYFEFFLHTRTHTHTHIYIYICIYIYVYTYIHTYTHTHTYSQEYKFGNAHLLLFHSYKL